MYKTTKKNSSPAVIKKAIAWLLPQAQGRLLGKLQPLELNKARLMGQNQYWFSCVVEIYRDYLGT
ncbi:hypothetical protein [Picosynechococcus sp. NKBG042902]|uniref:hypothetical protein n=1 Tax=Picosynechococcus sp. NKBG042902 TaxID=490193 RepID=UPI001268E92D|nr:hypothetical protein [Picosynechococcus sp. NKBG042902]